MGLLKRFQADPQVRRYTDVLRSEIAQRSVYDIVEFFDSPDTIRRMIESEKHHNRPAIAGVVKDLELLFQKQVSEANQLGESKAEGPSAMRRNQIIGVIVRLVMESKGWKPTGKKGSLAGLSYTFRRGEHYAPAAEHD